MVSVLFKIGMEFTGEIAINVGVTKGKKVVCDNVKFFCSEKPVESNNEKHKKKLVGYRLIHRMGNPFISQYILLGHTVVDCPSPP